MVIFLDSFVIHLLFSFSPTKFNLSSNIRFAAMYFVFLKISLTIALQFDSLGCLRDLQLRPAFFVATIHLVAAKEGGGISSPN